MGCVLRYSIIMILDKGTVRTLSIIVAVITILSMVVFLLVPLFG